MAIYDEKWFEIWYAEGVDIVPSHLLIVTPKPENTSQVLIIDPYDKGKIIYEGKNYGDACSWLWEDEYSQISGRMFTDDGWG
jgi:hypothetical protein